MRAGVWKDPGACNRAKHGVPCTREPPGKSRGTVTAVAVIFDSQGKGRMRRAGPWRALVTASETKHAGRSRKVSEATEAW